MSIMWWNWRANSAGVFDVARPRDGQALPRAAEVRRDLLGPLERRVECPRPRHRHVRVGRRRTPGVVELELLGDREVQDAVVGGVLVGRAGQRALGAGAVVAIDVDDQRVVEFAHVLDLLNDAADLVVGIGRVARDTLRPVGRRASSGRATASPTSASSSGQGVSLRICGNDAQAVSGWRRSARAWHSSPCRTCP